MLFTTPRAAEFISGAILYDETIRQKSSGGTPLAEVLLSQGMVPGIKVDTGAEPLAGSPEEKVTEGLDGLRDRLAEYHGMGARFAKWRAVIRITDRLPSVACVSANAHALARYAALCQEQRLVPIVEPEVLMNGSHGIERCEEVTGTVLHAVFDALFEQGVSLEAMLLKPSMVIAGMDCARQASVEEVATATLRCLRRHVPAAVPGIVFLSGGQKDRLATAHLNAINRLPGPKPWKISFSYGRALQDAALEAWHGRDENLKAGQQALLPPGALQRRCRARRVHRCDGGGMMRAGCPAHRRERRRLTPQDAARTVNTTCRALQMRSSMRQGSEEAIMANALSDQERALIDAYWRAANYLSVGQIYLYDNPLLKEPLAKEHIKPRLLGHWGTTPGLNFIYVHLNRLIKQHDLDMIYITGPGHGGPGAGRERLARGHLQRGLSEHLRRTRRA